MTVSDVWMTPTPFKESRLWRFSSSAVLLLVSVCSKVIFGLNKPSVYRKEAFNRCVAKRPQSKPLITVSNHYSMIDDFLVSYMLPWKQLRNRPSIRWLPGAKDVCCRTKPTSLFFQLGRVIPVVRGDGVYQHGMDFCASRLDEGEWVHIYPEGKVNTTKDFMRLKWGVGRLIADSKVSPLVLPYWHLGMENMFPTKKPYYPRVGNKITVVFGEPIDFEEDLRQLREQKKTEEEVRKYVTDKIQEVFAKLKSETETRHKGFCATIDT
ncbi:tafazzin-like isoform X2 [Mercenaria mercenaria]|nr:tafazzin-like isoform X2 [Mercenaria mercenaria]